MEIGDYPNTDGISDLEMLQGRILAVEKVVVDEFNRLEKQKSSSNKVELKAAMREIEELKSKCSSRQEKEERWIDHEILVKDHLKSIKTKPEISEARKGILMKDIPLDQVSDGSIFERRSKRGKVRVDDQMLELWQAAEDDRRLCQTVGKSKRHQYTPRGHDIGKIEAPSSVLQIEKELGVDNSITVFNQGGNKGRILQRLASDGQKLASLQTSVQDMKKKLQMNKKSKKTKGVDFETMKEQLKEVEESVVQLVELNDKLTGSIEKSKSPSFKDGVASREQEEELSIQTKSVSEEARKGSEKIGRLQLEVQKIHYVLLKLDDEKKSKGKSRFSRTKSRTSVILRDFIYSGRRGSGGRRKKGCLRGCFRPSSASGESSRRSSSV